MTLPRVMVTARLFRDGGSAAFDYLEASPIELVPPPRESPLSEAELLPLLAGIDGIIAGTDELTAAVIRAAPRLKVISRRGVGFETVDVQAATECGVVVTNVPALNADAVADFAFAMLLDAARGLSWMDRQMKAGVWKVVAGRQVWGKTLGIVGLGNIGKAVARRARGFDMRILAHDICPDLAFAAEHGVELVSLNRLLAEADFVTLHCSLTPETRGLIGEAELRTMKPEACLINAARGAIVDEAALLRALEQGWIAGAALDAFEREPLPLDHPFLKQDRLVLTPHSAFNTLEATAAVNLQAARNCVAVLLGERPASVVNPEVYDSR